MISWFFISLLKANPEQALTENGLMTRFAVVLFLLVLYLVLFVFILKKRNRSRIRRLTALLLSVVLLFESVELLPYLQSEKHVLLEYVSSVETTRIDPINKKVIWSTNCSVYSSVPVKKELIESYLECDLTNIELNNDKYTYLFVLYYKDVDLIYSNWSKSSGRPGCTPSKNVFWIGRLEVTGEATKNTIYIFRFPRKIIVPNNTGASSLA